MQCFPQIWLSEPADIDFSGQVGNDRAGDSQFPVAAGSDRSAYRTGYSLLLSCPELRNRYDIFVPVITARERFDQITYLIYAAFGKKTGRLFTDPAQSSQIRGKTSRFGFRYIVQFALTL